MHLGRTLREYVERNVCTHVGHECAALHDVDQPGAPLRAGLALGPQQVPRRQVREAVPLHDALALGALAGTRTTYQHTTGGKGQPHATMQPGPSR